MPYIKEDDRKKLNSLIDEFADKVKEMYKDNPAQTRDGLLNYSITRLLNKVYADARYHDFNELIGMLECCKLEYYRKYLSPYEDLKEVENGAVETFNKKDKTGYWLTNNKAPKGALLFLVTRCYKIKFFGLHLLMFEQLSLLEIF